MLEYVRSIKDILGPWPTVGLAVGLASLPFLTLLGFFARNLRLGPLAIELRRATQDLDELSLVLAESRVVELEVAARQFVTSLSDHDKQELREQVDRLRAVVKKLRSTERS
jgi:hypothetical protein